VRTCNAVFVQGALDEFVNESKYAVFDSLVFDNLFEHKTAKAFVFKDDTPRLLKSTYEPAVDIVRLKPRSVGMSRGCF